jgi:hypothetical protein
MIPTRKHSSGLPHFDLNERLLLRLPDALGIVAHNTLQKAQSFCCELFGRVGEFAPDAAELGDTFHVGIKRLYRDAALRRG